MKAIQFFTLLCVLTTSLTFVQAQEGKDNKDFTFDKDSNSIIPNYLGKVIILKGKATAKRKGADVPLSKGAKLYPKDIINTSARSFLKIEMVDTTLMTAGPSTKLSFENWQYKTKEDRKATFNLMQGKMRAHFKVKAKEDQALKIRVGHVAMGVRGTRILANKYEQRGGTQVSHVATLSGKTVVYDKVKDYQVEQKAGGQYISFLKKDGSLIKGEDRNLSPSELKYLKSDDKDPRKYFRPFMKEFTGKEITSQEESSASPSQEYTPSTYKKNRRRSGAWKKTLNKLNEKLKDSD